MNTLDPLIEGYLAYLDKVGRKTPRTIVDVRCTLRRAWGPLWRHGFTQASSTNRRCAATHL